MQGHGKVMVEHAVAVGPAARTDIRHGAPALMNPHPTAAITVAGNRRVAAPTRQSGAAAWAVESPRTMIRTGRFSAGIAGVLSAWLSVVGVSTGLLAVRSAPSETPTSSGRAPRQWSPWLCCSAPERSATTGASGDLCGRHRRGARGPVRRRGSARTRRRPQPDQLQPRPSPCVWG